MRKDARVNLNPYYLVKVLDGLMEGPGYIRQMAQRGGIREATIRHHLKPMIKAGWISTAAGEGDNGAWVVNFALTDKGKEAQQLFQRTNELLNAL